MGKRLESIFVYFTTLYNSGELMVYACKSMNVQRHIYETRCSPLGVGLAQSYLEIFPSRVFFTLRRSYLERLRSMRFFFVLHILSTVSVKTEKVAKLLFHKIGKICNATQHLTNFVDAKYIPISPAFQREAVQDNLIDVCRFRVSFFLPTSLICKFRMTNQVITCAVECQPMLCWYTMLTMAISPM